MKNISKEVFLNILACPTLGWLLGSGQNIEQLSKEVLTLGEQFRMDQGIEIHNRARQLYPDGTLVQRRDMVIALQETMNLMSNSNISTIFEATFLIDDYATKADVLRRKDSSWHLIEVKSSVNDRDEFIDDMAYTVMVIAHAGFNLSTISLLLISKDYRLGMANKDLFVEIDHTDEVLDRVELFESVCDQVKEITETLIKPEPELKRDCKNCPLFAECLGKGIENHILEIPRLHQTKLDRLKDLGIVCIEDIPDEFPLTDKQARVRDCVITRKPFVGSQLRSDLEAISWPTFYLDFETVMTAIPLYPDIAPYTQLPIQYSMHKCSDIGHVIDHREYLADPSKDCRREISENLIRDLEHSGSIIIYSGFEKDVISRLQLLCPDLVDKLSPLVERMIDLEKIINKNFYHPDFHGSTSIKRTLPVIVPEMSYDELDIADGASASAAFAYLALGKYVEETEVESVRRNLLDYCKQDTLAMVKIHEKLYEYV